LVEINARKRDQKLAEKEAALEEMRGVLEELKEGQEARALARIPPGLSTREHMLGIWNFEVFCDRTHFQLSVFFILFHEEKEWITGNQKYVQCSES